VGFRIAIIGNNINCVCADMGWCFLVVVNFIADNVLPLAVSGGLNALTFV